MTKINNTNYPIRDSLKMLDLTRNPVLIVPRHYVDDAEILQAEGYHEIIETKADKMATVVFKMIEQNKVRWVH